MRPERLIWGSSWVMGGLTLRGDLNLCIGKVSASLRGTWVNENLQRRQNGQWSKEFDLEKVRRVLPVKSLSCKEVEEKLGLSLDGFLREHLVPDSPVILCDSMTHCPAMNRWNDMNCLKQVAGFDFSHSSSRKNYLNQEWKQELITFSEFLERIQSIDYAFANVTYLTQHQLFD